jgi:pimeloyl-ACP methyl ester carboxylesterase
MFQDSLRNSETTRTITEDGIADMAVGVKCFKPKVPIMPKVVTDEELKGFKVPMLCMFGENEVICSPEKALRRLNRLCPRINTLIIPRSGHDLFIARAEMMTSEAIAFLKDE